jgi:hypothetical protein
VGVIVPIVCLLLDFKPATVMRVCEFCWPSGFMLLAMETQFNLAIVLVSIMINTLIWAGIGWVIGYGMSARTQK